jgi:hypothetical protein
MRFQLRRRPSRPGGRERRVLRLPERRSLDPDPARHLAETNAWIVEALDENGEVEDDADSDQSEAEK